MATSIFSSSEVVLSPASSEHTARTLQPAMCERCFAHESPTLLLTPLLVAIGNVQGGHASPVAAMKRPGRMFGQVEAARDTVLDSIHVYRVHRLLGRK